MVSYIAAGVGRDISSKITSYDGYEFSFAQMQNFRTVLNNNPVEVAVYLQGTHFRTSNKTVVPTFTFQRIDSTQGRALRTSVPNIFLNGMRGPRETVSERYFVSLNTPNSVLCQLTNGSGRLIRRTVTTGATLFDTVFGAETIVQLSC